MSWLQRDSKGRTHRVCDECGSVVGPGDTEVRSQQYKRLLEDAWLLSDFADRTRFDGTLHFCRACAELPESARLIILCTLENE